MSDHSYTSVHTDYQIGVDQCFSGLQALDAELCDRLMSVFRSRNAALSWLMTNKLAGDLPISLLIDGRRREVVEALVRIEHGVYI